jgi:hypothetical protein
MQLDHLDQIRLCKRIDLNAIHQKFHPLFITLINQAPDLKEYDYDGLQSVIRTWFDNPHILRYSGLDYLVQPGTRVQYSSVDGLSIENIGRGNALQFVDGTCAFLAIKVLLLTQICYPWANAIFANKQKWKGSGSNHCFVILAPKGFLNYTNRYTNTNLFFGDESRNDQTFDLFEDCSDFVVIDPTKKLIGQLANYPEYQNSGYDSSMSLKNGRWVIQSPIPKEGESSCSSYLHSFNGDFEGTYFSLGTLRQDHVTFDTPMWLLYTPKQNYCWRFDDTNFIEACAKLDRGVAEKIRIIVNRGLVRV